MIKIIFLFFIITASHILPVYAGAGRLCFTEAGALYNIDPLLLRSIGIVESNLKKDAIGKNRNARGESLSEDYGIMQINQMHIPSLVKRGIIQDKSELLTNPCLNIKIGSEILNKHFLQCGMNWYCLGTYNTGFSKRTQSKRLVYARKIYQIYIQLKAVEAERKRASVSNE
ncbi:TPA: lytic transglycosylase domain-containing protein [Escherichia fergusonii]|uniref:lytic transglycosylase domain-containing protein n=1 Tax=Escherichia fergusonii TaxID=564 RepID=UPI000F661842|nr:lytic transglycosylase domain-containing protein [Escherichia fergusonii]EHG5998750.1 lytic transglycosylase domain-containing protein [Escherichia fergusonii]MBA8500746.1 lytic transglycosylase domain-containing protein [Escherichia fergusonii]QCZ31458.1 lytic transglycosylase domain-containing protein [Escherichia fergusonii]HAI1306454.1 lytic transglycosylase domain-containing protein [Escherichia fergusonii]HCO8235815.1 lytic transglycosylase domain-containing protein [Escherichia fergu